MFQSDFSDAGGNSALIHKGLEPIENDLHAVAFADSLEWRKSIAAEEQPDGDGYKVSPRLEGGF